MIIQCEQCKTKFRLDDSKVTEKGVKVRCAKCRYIFTVVKQDERDSQSSDFSSLLDRKKDAESSADGYLTPSDPFPESTTFFADASSENPETDLFQKPDRDETFPDPFGNDLAAAKRDSDEIRIEADIPDSGANADFASDDPFAGISFGHSEKPEESMEDSNQSGFVSDMAPDSDNPFAGISSLFSEATANSGTGSDSEEFSAKEPASPGDSTGDPLFSYSSGTGLEAAPAEMESFPDSASATKESVFGDEPFPGVDDPFSEERNFGTARETSETGEGTLLQESDSISFDFVDFAPAEKPESSESGTGDIATAAPEASSEKDDDFFDFNSFNTEVHDGGREEEGAPDIPLPAVRETVQAFPNASGTTVVEERPSVSVLIPEENEELPPLSISSRRKSSSVITFIAAILGILALSAAAFYAYSYFVSGSEKNVAETGEIKIGNVEAAYIKNSSAGEMLVVSGELQNGFRTPRASIQVKVMLYDSKGAVIATKYAYAGNQLNMEQLASMPLERIEAAMSNQFGDSLSNLGVQPGKTIPFVVVIPAPPAEAKDYGVEPAGSTVAAVKQ